MEAFFLSVSLGTCLWLLCVRMRCGIQTGDPGLMIVMCGPVQREKELRKIGPLSYPTHEKAAMGAG